MKKFSVTEVSYDKKLDIVETLLNNMKSKHDGAQAGYILGGDVGVGKTSFIKDFARLLGLDLIVIETPHLVEEHIIDIPFITFDSATDGESKDHIKADTTSKQFNVELAQSKLYTSLKNSKKSTDAQLLKAMYSKADQSTVKVFEALGGSEKEIPDEIADLRSKYKCILFLDEYFRQSSNSIRNMLRSILNGRIGQNDLPDDVYVVFASNLKDEGVGEVLTNEDFKMITFETPSKDEWFGYFVSKYEKDNKVKLNASIIDKFYDLLEEEHLAFDDMEADVRTSPRRWEQLLLYINSSLPVKDEDDAKKLLTNVEHNFRDYQTGAKSSLAKGVMKAVAELVEETSNIKISEHDTVSSKDWRNVLEHQIEQKIKLGAHRKYIPVISGAPGIGKTKHVTTLCVKMNLVPVFIDVHNLSAEDVIGIPVPETGKSVNVKFSIPALAKDIENQIEKGVRRFKERVNQEFDKAEAAKKIKEFEKSPYKYLLFFDELNRTSTKVFNAVRRVILEKDFGDGTSIPEESIIVAAINPVSNGTVELTKHMKDVLDIIPAGVSWNGFKRHIATLTPISEKEHAHIIKNVYEHFIDRFRVKNSPSEDIDPHFFLNIGSSPVYVSPREWTDLLINMSNYFEKVYNREEKKLVTEIDDEPNYAKLEEVLRKALFKQFSHTLDYIIKVKNSSELPEFDATMKEWFEHGDIGIGSAFVKKVKQVKLADIIDTAFDNQDANLYDDVEFVNYMISTDTTVFREELTDFLVDKIGDDILEGVKAVTEKTHVKKEIHNDSVKVGKKEASKLEFALKEIIHAIKLHKLADGKQQISNGMLEAVRMATKDMMAKISDKAEHKYGAFSNESMDVDTATLAFNGEIHDYIMKL